MERKWRYTSVEICRTVRVQVTLSWILVNHIFIQLYFGLGTIFHISFYTCYIMFVLYTVVIFLYINRHRSSVPMSIICIIWSVRSLINVEMLIGLNSINFTIKRIATQMSIELKYRAALHFNTILWNFSDVNGARIWFMSLYYKPLCIF